LTQSLKRCVTGRDREVVRDGVAEVAEAGRGGADGGVVVALLPLRGAADSARRHHPSAALIRRYTGDRCQGLLIAW